MTAALEENNSKYACRSVCAMSHYFNPPFASAYSLSRQKAKRKRATIKSDDDTHDSEQHNEPIEETDTEALDLTYLFRADVEQCKVSGHSLGRPFPKFPFPYASDDYERTHRNRARSVDIGICNDRTNSSKEKSVDSSHRDKVGPQTLREQHLNVVNAVLHRSLLRGDFERAAKAWAILLRAEVNGRPYDIRPQNRWGIGAEILLRKYAHTDMPRIRGSEEAVRGSNIKSNSQSITPEGIMEAKTYYDRLILQYPARKYDSKSIDSSTFYPAMFGLWIYQVKLQTERAVEALQGQYESCSAEDDVVSNSEESRPRERLTTPQSLERELVTGQAHGSEAEHGYANEQVTAIRATELKSAEELAAQLDEVLSSPPHDKNNDLLQLRGMIALWIGDLVEMVSEATGASGDDSISAESPPAGDGVGKRSFANQAREYFEKVLENGGVLQSKAEEYLVFEKM